MTKKKIILKYKQDYLEGHMTSREIANIAKCSITYVCQICKNYDNSKNVKRFNELHPETIRKYKKKYRDAHKPEAKEYRKKYYAANRERITEASRKYRQEHKDQLREYRKKIYIESKRRRSEKDS